MQNFSNVNSFQCPVCGLVDTVTKVSAIVEAGTTSHTASHSTVYTRGLSVRGFGSGTSSGTSATQLARKLSPPTLPQFRLAAPGYNCLLVVIFFFVSAFPLFFGETFVKMGAASIGIPLLIVGGILPVYIIVGGVGTMIVRNIKRPSWQKAMLRWNTLYYCARNDVVFVPGSSTQYTSSSNMLAFLYHE